MSYPNISLQLSYVLEKSFNSLAEKKKKNHTPDYSTITGEEQMKDF